MKKASNKTVQADNDMRAEYNFTGGVRGKHYHAMQAGYTITIHKADGTTVTKEVKPKAGAVVLEPDVRARKGSSLLLTNTSGGFPGFNHRGRCRPRLG